MKQLTKTLFCTIIAIALNSAFVHAMEHTTSNDLSMDETASAIDLTLCSLGNVELSYTDCETRDGKPNYLLQQRLYFDKTPIGFIEYSDYTKEQSTDYYRYISHIEINDNMRGKGIGSACMRQFIEQAEREGVMDIHLHTEPAAMSFYQRLAFQPKAAGSQYLKKKINPIGSYNPLFKPAI